MKYGYYPGCSLEKNAASYNVSTMAIAEPLGIDFQELDDWNCCGATEYMTLNRMAAYALITRNLALAEKQLTNSKQVVAPCSMCFLNMTKADHYLVEDKELANKVNIALGAGDLHYTPGAIQARHLLEILIEDIGVEAISSKVTKPLSGLKVAPYYGCLITRPGYLSKFDDYEYPTSLDRIMKGLGATVVDYPMKAHCCGGHMTQISQGVALELIRQLLQNAAEYEADIIVTLCPMCQLNLDAYQGDVNRFFKTKYHIPILYFTQMMGLAFGLSASELGIGKELVDARAALSKIGVSVPEPEPAKKKKPTKEELPMPRMPEES
jgi:heterodisulfide reductase subunit B2